MRALGGVLQRCLLLGGALAVVGLAACGGGPAGEARLPPTPDTASVLQGAELGAGDVVEVRVYQEAELTGLYRVDADGTFDFPLVGQVAAGGKTPGELSQILTERLKDGYLRDPQVSVFVKEFNSKKVFVLGEVHKPGTFKYEDRMTIVQAITLAGGLKPLAAKNGIVLTRVVAGAEEKFVVPFEQIGLGREPNVALQPGDIVFVPESWL